MSERPLIVLMTDFGNDAYTGIMKGRIIQINPAARIVALTNHIKKHSIRQGAFILQKSYRYFPYGSIFLVVVDPGVGSIRKAVVAQTENYFFIAPDNGILSPVISESRALDIIKLHIPSDASTTFHGRDVFAPAAAKVSLNYSLLNLGPKTKLDKNIRFYWDPGSFTGEVIFKDEFGNIITNIPKLTKLYSTEKFIVITELFEGEMPLKISYSEGSTHEPFLIFSSFDTLEIALREGRACDLIPVSAGDRVTITPL
ncbi:MAG: S-adenosyl-l-methionine hydroxide adenosyltransferase family protein [Candidatus Heimdallarchaeota archaeon]